MPSSARRPSIFSESTRFLGQPREYEGDGFDGAGRWGATHEDIRLLEDWDISRS